MPEGISWTAAEVDTIRQLAAADYSAGQIGRQLGRSRNSVMGKISRLGLRLSPKDNYGHAPGTSERAKERAGLPSTRKRVRKPLQFKSRTRPSVPVLEQFDLDQESIGMTFADWRPGTDCAWVLGEVKGAATLYCGCPTVLRGSWCARHHRVVFQCAASR